MVKQYVTPLGPEYLHKPSSEWPTREVEPCTEYYSCRIGASSSTAVCGKCMRIGNPPEPVKVRVSRPDYREER